MTKGPDGARGRTRVRDGRASMAPAPPKVSRRAALTLLAASGVLSSCGRVARLAGSAEVSRGRAAMILPLTGRASALGQSMRAAATLGGVGVGATAELEILDGGDSPESAARAAAAAVEAGARMIVGPLFAAQTAATVAAVPRSVPVVSLSNDVSVAQGRAFVFGVTPFHSAQAILSYAARTGLRRIALVVPPGAFGERAVAASRTVAPSLGITLAPVLTRSAPDGLLAAVSETGAPDAVYLPAAGESLPAFAAALPGVQLLGSTQWLGIDPPSVPALRGAFFAAPDPLRFEPFARAYEATTGEGPGILGGLAFDGAETARLLGRAGEQDRNGLLREDGFDGVLGSYAFGADGRCQRSLAVLRAEEGGIAVVSGTAT